jgi:hypothetical protein
LSLGRSYIRSSQQLQDIMPKQGLFYCPALA